MPEKTLDIRVRLIAQEMGGIQEHLRSIGALTDRGNQSMTRKAAATSRATQETLRLSKAEQTAAIQAGNLMNAVRGGERSLNRLSMGFRRARREAGAFGREEKVALDRGTQAAERHRRSLRGLGQEMQQLTGFAQLLRGVLNAFLLYKGFVFLQEQARQAIGELVDLQHELGIVQTQLLDTGQDFRLDIRTNVLEIASETGVSMVALAKAEFEVVSANIAVADSYEILNLAAKATVAGGLQDTELAFNAALSQANVFGKTVAEFDEVFDAQFQVIRRGIFTYEQFATVVGTVSEAFASAGQNVETTNASLAAISLVFTGKQLERGATGLRNAVLRLSEAPDMFEDLGVRITDAEGDFRNFLDIGRDLKRVLDGLSQSARARVVKELFPDKRERRGINALLTNLEEAEQFLVEQQFAVGSLDDAYDTVNDSLRTQANILRQDVTPGLESVVAVADGFLTILNKTNDVLPGINRNLATTAVVAGVVGSGFLLTGGRFPLRAPAAVPINAGPIRRGASRFMGANMPTGAGLGAAGLVGATQVAAGARPGALQAGDFLGAALTGGATGAFLGGPAGAAIGAAVSLGALALGQAFEKDAPEVAKSFSQAFSDELKNRTGDVALALAAAIGTVMGQDRGTLTPEQFGARLFKEQGREISASFRAQNIGGIPIPAGEIRGARRREILREFDRIGRAEVELSDTGVFGMGRARGEITDREELVKLLSGEGAAITPATEAVFTFRQTPAAAIAAVADEAQDAVDALALHSDSLRLIALAEDTTAEELRKIALEKVISDTIKESAAGFEEGGRLVEATANIIAEALTEGTIRQDQVNEALRIMSEEGIDAFLQFTGRVQDASGEIERTFAVVAAEFETLFVGDAELAADVFRHLGAEGEKLADVFSEIGRVTQAFTLLQQLQEFEVRDPVVSKQIQTNEELLAETRAEIQQLMSTEGALSAEDQRRLEAFQVAETALVKRGENLGGRETMPLLDRLFGPDAALEVGETLLTQIEGLVGDLEGDLTAEELLRALFGTVDASLQDATGQLQLGANTLADSLFEASDAVRFGLIDGMGFASEQLEMLGEEAQILNKFVRQRGILEELQNIAEFSGIGTDGIKGAMSILRQDMIRSGQEFFRIMSDPGKLAELIANMEFGDVNVDQSTQFVIPSITISEGVASDPARLANVATELIANIRNQLAREGLGRR